MIKTFEQFDWDDDPFEEDIESYKKSYIGYNKSLLKYIIEINCGQAKYYFDFLNRRENMFIIYNKRLIINDLLNSLMRCGVDGKSLEKIKEELVEKYT